MAACQPVWRLCPCGPDPGTARLLILFFLYEFAFYVYPAIWLTTTLRFGWDPVMIGVSLGSFGIATAVVQGGLIRLILLLGERMTVLYGFVFNGFAFFLLAVVANPTPALVLTPLTAWARLWTLALQSMIAQKAGPDAQGEMQGVVAFGEIPGGDLRLVSRHRSSMPSQKPMLWYFCPERPSCCQWCSWSFAGWFMSQGCAHRPLPRPVQENERGIAMETIRAAVSHGVGESLVIEQIQLQSTRRQSASSRSRLSQSAIRISPSSMGAGIARSRRCLDMKPWAV